VPDKPGTSALAGDAPPDRLHLRVCLVSDDPGGAIGVIVRYQDATTIIVSQWISSTATGG
jgi:hypothetical protein